MSESAPDVAASAGAAADGLVVFEQHVSHPPITADVQKSIDALRASLLDEPLLKDHPSELHTFCTPQNLHRYLRARQFDLVKAKKLLLDTLAWRIAYKPDDITAAQVEAECATGKIRVLSTLDRYNRPIIVMDSSRENSKTHDSQIRHLVWQLVRAERKMNGGDRPEGVAGPPADAPTVEKYCLFINMERNSIWNSPPMKTSTETLKMFTDRFPEHLGTAVVYKPGMLFSGLWAVCKPLMDAKTVSKIKFVRGDVSDGSANDKMLRELICDDWRALCDNPKDSYDHKAFWPTVLQDEANYNARHAAEAAAAEAAAAAACVAAAPAPAADAVAPVEAALAAASIADSASEAEAVAASDAAEAVAVENALINELESPASQ